MPRVLLRLSSAVTASMLIVACEGAIDRVVGPAEPTERPVLSSQLLGSEEVRTVFGPRLFVRGTGAPMTESLTLEGFASEATLRIANGDASGGARVSSGTVLVDGQEVVHSSDFGQKVAFIAVPITLRNTSAISVRLASAPGDRITLSVEGRLATSATVTAAGGTLHLLGSQVTLVAPAGAVGSSVQLTAEPVAVPRPEAVPGTSVEMGPTGTVFSAPVTLSIAFDPAALPVGAKPASLRMHWWNTDHWEALPSNIVDVARGVVSARTTHFTTFALLPNEVVFCPGDAGAEGDLRSAIMHVPENGTVYVCDGTFPVAQVLIDKPLTLRSLNAGGATLADAEPGGNNQTGTPIVRIDGVPAGLVRIADLGFVVTDQGIRPDGLFDKVEIDNVRFSGAPGALTVGVVVAGSSVPGARVEVTNSDFSVLQLGVWPLRAVETNVRLSHFERFTGGAVVYSHGGTEDTQSFGHTEDNTFTNCGSSGCVRVLSAGAVVVARNRFEAMDQLVSAGAVTVSTGSSYPNAAPTVIEDNVIVSRRTGASETTAAGWMFQSGIALSDANLRTAVVRGNHVTDVYSGVTSTASVNVTDNWFTGGVYAIRQTAMREATFQRNDVTGLLGSFTTPLPGSSFQCNWWGTTAGPTAPPAGTQWAYTPWANESIADSGVPCVSVPVPPVPPLATITVSPSPFAVLPGGTQQFTATGRDASGNVVAFSPTWSVTSGGGSISPTGLFTAGTTTGLFANTVRATSGVIVGTATVAVGEMASVIVSPNPAAVLMGGTLQFAATARDANGYQMNPPIPRVWSVANGGGSISASGLFAAGTTTGTFANTVTVAYGTVTGAATVVITAPPATITVTPSTATVLSGSAKPFTATGHDANGNVVPISPTWSLVSGGGTINQGGVFVAGAVEGIFTGTVKAAVGPTYGTASVSVISQLPTVVRVCAAPGAEVTVPTVSEAVALVAAGGTVRICDGTHVAANLAIARPVTITAEGPGRPMIDAGSQTRTWGVQSTAGTVVISNLQFKGLMVAAGTGSAGTSLSLEGNAFDDCWVDNACVMTSMPSRIVNNAFTARLGHHVNVAIALGSQPSGQVVYTVTDNRIEGVERDSTQANLMSGYPWEQAIGVYSGVAEVSRNRITNASWGIVASLHESRPASTVTAFDNILRSTYFPLGRIGEATLPGSFTANWNDVSDFDLLESDVPAGVFSLRCNWWGGAAGPTSVSVFESKFYTPWATSPVAGQAHSGCDPTGAALASITITPNPDTLVAGATQRFVATGYDGNGIATPVTPVWSVTNGGGTIDASSGLFTAGSIPGTFANTIRATSGVVTESASLVVTVPPPAAEVRVCDTPGEGVTVPTVAEALGRVVPGGTVRICDGTHAVSSLTFASPVTVTAEGPGMPTLDAGAVASTWWVAGSVSGAVRISNLRFRGHELRADVVSTSASLSVEGSEFEDCGTYACVSSSIPTRIVNNTFTARIERPFSHIAVLGVHATTVHSFIVTDNTILGVGNDPAQANMWSRYPLQSAAIYVFSGVVDIARNHLTNSFWGIVAALVAARPDFTVTAVDNVVRQTYFPIGTIGSDATSSRFTANWNDFSESGFGIAGPQPGLLNLRCNWWGQASAPTLMNEQVPPPSAYTPFATSPVAGQAHSGCDPTGASLASITITPNPDTLVAGAAQQFVATGYDGNGIATPVTPVWSVTNGGGMIDASSGLFTAGSIPGTFANTIRATSGAVTGSASLVVTVPPLAAEVRVCDTPGEGVTVPTVADALGRVAPGGTVRVCDGTHVVNNVVLSQPLTITAEGPGMPTLDASDGASVFAIQNVPSGIVAISRLRFTGGSPQQVLLGSGIAAAITLTENEFVTTASQPYGGDWGAITVSAVRIGTQNIGTVTVDRNSFVGGDVGVDASTLLLSGRVNVTRNSFRTMTFMAARVFVSPGLAASSNFEGNTFEDCGNIMCINAIGTSRIVSNTFTANIGRPVSVFVSLGTALTAPDVGTLYVVTDNTMTGIGSPNPRYPVQTAAIGALSGTAELARNRITNAYWGIFVGSEGSTAIVTAVDNVIETTYQPLSWYNPPTPVSHLTANWNDFVDYVRAFDNPQALTLNLRCNWWGQAAAPSLLNEQVPPPSVYTPFATAPVAGQPHTGCDPSGAALAWITVSPNPDTLVAGGTRQFVATGYDGNGNVTPVTPTWSVSNGGGTIDATTGLFTAGTASGMWVNTIRATSGFVSGAGTVVVLPPPQVAAVRVCSTAGNGVTVPTVAQALGLVADGGTVLICDGTYMVNEVEISRPVTITAEGPGMPTLDAGASSTVFLVSGAPSSLVTISGLRMTGGIEASVKIVGPVADVNITENDFQAGSRLASVRMFGGANGTITIDRNTFTGGMYGVMDSGLEGGQLVITRNQFAGLISTAISFHVFPVRPPQMRIDNNTFEDCGGTECIWAGAPSTIVNNTFTVSTAHPVGNVIFLTRGGASPFVVSDNSITGVGTQPGDFSIWNAGVFVSGSNAEVSRNHITSAKLGLVGVADSAQVVGSNITAVDNTIRRTNAPIGGSSSAGALSVLTANWNDFSEYVTAVASAGSYTLNMRCNWWGQPTGPTALDATVSASVYTPFAVTAVAGQEHTGCTP